MTELIEHYREYLMPTFAPSKVLARGEGVHVWDSEDNRYLDLLGGLAVNSLGHAHPAVIEAVTAQLATLGHISNFFASEPQIELAERLVALVGAPAKVFFTNSGTEANEAAFKLTRKTGRTRVLSTVGAFHGRTMGALALTWKPAYREPFEPLPGGVEFVEYGDTAALRAAFADGDPIAAFVVEPIQGENGVMVPPDDYLAVARELCTQHGALLWIDEVQTGIGRTGEWFGYQHCTGVLPDLITVAKGLGAGFPIGACIGLGTAGELFAVGNHGSTFGGNPPAAAAGLAVLDTIESDDLLANATKVGEYLMSAITALELPQVSEVRGRGLLIGIGLNGEYASKVAAAALRAGFIVNDANPSTIRLAPALILTQDQAGEFLAGLPQILQEGSRA